MTSIRKYLLLMIITYLLFIFPMAHSEDKISGYYQYAEVEEGIKITRYLGEEKNCIVPEMIDGKKVRVIGEDAFSFNEAIWNVKLPDTIQEIEQCAFDSCSLRQINLPEGLKRVETAAFASSKITSIYFPESVEYLGEFLFWECKNIRSAYIGAKITVLPKGIFADCTYLHDVYLSDSIEQIDDDAFNWCTDLTYIHFPKNLRYLGSRVFSGVSKISEEDKQIIHDIYANDESIEYEEDELEW